MKIAITQTVSLYNKLVVFHNSPISFDEIMKIKTCIPYLSGNNQ